MTFIFIVIIVLIASILIMRPIICSVYELPGKIVAIEQKGKIKRAYRGKFGVCIPFLQRRRVFEEKDCNTFIWTKKMSTKDFYFVKTNYRISVSVEDYPSFLNKLIESNMKEDEFSNYVTDVCDEVMEKLIGSYTLDEIEINESYFRRQVELNIRMTLINCGLNLESFRLLELKTNLVNSMEDEHLAYLRSKIEEAIT